MKNQNEFFIVLYCSLFSFIILVSLLLTWDILKCIATVFISGIDHQAKILSWKTQTQLPVLDLPRKKGEKICSVQGASSMWKNKYSLNWQYSCNFRNLVL